MKTCPFTFICVLAAALGLGACSSSSSSDKPDAGPFAGNWKWVGSQGGIAGIEYTPAKVGYTCTFNFDANSSTTFKRNDSVKAVAPYPIIKESDGSYSIAYASDSIRALVRTTFPVVMVASSDSLLRIAISIHNDTINTFERNMSDGLQSLFVRQ